MVYQIGIIVSVYRCLDEVHGITPILDKFSIYRETLAATLLTAAFAAETGEAVALATALETALARGATTYIILVLWSSTIPFSTFEFPSTYLGLSCSNSRVASTESLLPALRHAAQDSDHAVIILLEPLRVALGLVDNGRGIGGWELCGTEDLGTVENAEGLEGCAVINGSGDGTEGEDNRDGESETHDDGLVVVLSER